MRRVLFMYLPVIHQGVLSLVIRQKPDHIYLFNNDILDQLDLTKRDARAIDPVRNALLLRTLIALEKGLEKTRVQVFGPDKLFNDIKDEDVIIMLNDDVSSKFAKKYFPDRPIVFDTAFIRWNMLNVNKKFYPDPDEKISADDFSKMMMELAKQKSEQSPDWWRQVGAVLVKDDEVVISTYNHHQPSKEVSYFEGDPRSLFDAGERTDLSLGEHAEARVIALCARGGFSTKDSKMFVTVFPCPNCARIMVTAGVKELYYLSGYSILNAREIFKHYGVKIFRVVM